MSRVIVHITTDHENNDDAARSVMSALKRAGYYVESHQVEGDSLTAAQITGNILGFVEYADPVFVTAIEPDVVEDPVG